MGINGKFTSIYTSIAATRQAVALSTMEGFAFGISQNAEALSICLTVKRPDCLLLCPLASLQNCRTLGNYCIFRAYAHTKNAIGSWAESKTIKPGNIRGVFISIIGEIHGNWVKA